MARGIMRYKACKGGGESMQDVVRNDRFSLGGIAPEAGGGCPCIKRGCPCITTLEIFTVSYSNFYQETAVVVIVTIQGNLMVVDPQLQ